MSKLILVTYADEKYKPCQERLIKIAEDSKQFDGFISLDSIWLKTNYFYLQNKNILDRPKGAGYCLWKPYILLNALNTLEYDNIILYIDSGDLLFNTNGLRTFLFETMADKNFILTEGWNKNSNWTKRDCFIGMNCDNSRYWNAMQLEAGVLAIKNTPDAINVVREWLEYCKNPAILTEDPNINGRLNLTGFKEHRYDQSVLTNLKIKYNLYASVELREFVDCNKNMPE